MSVYADPLIKQPLEQKQYGLDFVNLLSTGESISTGSTQNGVTVDSTEVSVGSTGLSYSGSQMLFWITGGKAGDLYRLQGLVETDAGSRHQADGHLQIMD
jgi:hypothetical protein